MKQLPIPIVGSSTFDRYGKMSLARTYNMIISHNCLVPYSGYVVAQTIASTVSGARALYPSIGFNHLFTVYDNRLYIISQNLGVTFIDTLATNSGAVYFAENDKQEVVAVDGLNIYVYNYGTSAFTTIKGSDLGILPVYVTYQDTYIIIIDGNSNRWRLSGNNDALNYPADSVGLIQTKPDLGRGVIGFNRQLFVMGKTVTEIWHDVGNTIFPYQRDNSISIDYGLLSPETLSSGFNKLVWLGSNEKAGPVLLVSTGGVPRKLATDGIEFLLSDLSEPEDSYGFLFEEDGHVFYQITFETDNVTLVYDFETEKFFNLSDECQGAHLARRAAFFNNRNYFVSNVDGFLYEFGTQFTTFNGLTIPRIRITGPTRMPDASRFLINNVNVTLEQGETRQLQRVDLSLSKNGGASFGNIVGKTLNDLGNRRNKLQWWHLGSANDVTFQFRFWSANTFSEQATDNYQVYQRNDQLMNRSERFVIIGGEMEIDE